MRRFFSIQLSLLCALALSSCAQFEDFEKTRLADDLPYPVIAPVVVSVEAEGVLNVSIDNENRNITLDLDERTDIRKVRIKDCNISVSGKDSARFEGGKITVKPEIKGTHDLTQPLVSTVTTFQDYIWTVSAVQKIDRYFSVRGQVGASVIDEANHRVIVYVSTKVDVKNMNVLTCKLGPEGITTYSVDPVSLYDFSDEVTIHISTTNSLEEDWTIYVEVVEFSVNIGKINPWTREAYINADGIAGEDNGFRFRIAGTDVWQTLERSDVTENGGSFTGHVTGLQPSTEYECIAYSGAETSDVETFTTDAATQLPNHSFETVSKITGKDYYKWFDPSSPDPECRQIWWASGNGEGPDGIDGTATLGVILTVPDSDAADGNLAVCAQSSKLAGILACGNLFTGQFTEIIGGAAGAVHYGRPWSTRPKALVLSYKYKGGPVDCVDDYPADDVVKLGDMDRCQIFVGVGDWDYKRYGGSPASPVRVSTADDERSTLFTPESAGIIGCGNFVTNKSVDKWTELRIPLEYRSLERKPTHIIIICAVNYRGDYMTGCSTAKLWLDNMRLEY